MNQRFSSSRRSGFTLIEILVVIVVILLMIGMAMPVFRVITGTRSEQGAANNISAMLSRARADAIGLQKPIGVAFVYNPNTQQSTMAEVEFPPISPYIGRTNYAVGQCVTTTSNGITYYYTATNPIINKTTQYPGASQSDNGIWQAVYGPPLEMRADTDVVHLPAGVAVQTICNTTFNNGQRQSDGYLSVGVILFDGKGRLASLPYGIAASSQLVAANGLLRAYPSSPSVIAYTTNGITPQYGVMSQFGLVLFQRDAYVGQGFDPNDPIYLNPTAQQSNAYASGNSNGQQAQESWIDQNSTPLLIDRYTGELIKAE